MILCAGEALIDMLPEHVVSGVQAFVPVPGGAAFNSAIGLARLGARAGMACPLSRDMFGDVIAQALAAAGIDDRLAPRVARNCTLAFVVLNDGQALYTFYDENSAMRALRPEDLPGLPVEVSTLLAGGISLAAEPCGIAFEALWLEAKGRLRMIDPNIRPQFVADEAAYRARLDRMMGSADIVKLSLDDLAWLAPETAPEAVVSALIARGVGVVLLTKGAAGADAWMPPDKRLGMAAPTVQVVDTVGAGDTFNAGFLAGLADFGGLSPEALRGLDDEALRAILGLAVRASALACTRKGANPPTRAELALMAGGSD